MRISPCFCNWSHMIIAGIRDYLLPLLSAGAGSLPGEVIQILIPDQPLAQGAFLGTRLGSK